MSVVSCQLSVVSPLTALPCASPPHHPATRACPAALPIHPCVPVPSPPRRVRDPPPCRRFIVSLAKPLAIPPSSPVHAHLISPFCVLNWLYPARAFELAVASCTSLVANRISPLVSFHRGIARHLCRLGIARITPSAFGPILFRALRPTFVSDPRSASACTRQKRHHCRFGGVAVGDRDG